MYIWYRGRQPRTQTYDFFIRIIFIWNPVICKATQSPKCFCVCVCVLLTTSQWTSGVPFVPSAFSKAWNTGPSSSPMSKKAFTDLSMGPCKRERQWWKGERGQAKKNHGQFPSIYVRWYITTWNPKNRRIKIAASVGWWTKALRLGNGWKSPFPSIKKWWSRVPGACHRESSFFSDLRWDIHVWTNIGLWELHTNATGYTGPSMYLLLKGRNDHW